MGRLTDTNIIYGSPNGDVFYETHFSIDVLHYTAPFLKRVFCRMPNMYDILYNACYVKESSTTTIKLDVSYYNKKMYGKDYFHDWFNVRPMFVTPYDYLVRDMSINGALTLSVEVRLTDHTTIPFVHIYDNGGFGAIGFTYKFCANTYGRDAVVTYLENELIPYIKSVPYTLFAEGLKSDGKDFDSLVLTPKKYIELKCDGMSTRTDYPETT